MEDNNKNTLEQGENTQEVEEQKEKTFTQSELDEIIKKRLGRERAKQEQEQNSNIALTELEQREKELARRELELNIKEQFAKADVPIELKDALNCQDVETVTNSLRVLKEYVKSISNNNKRLATGMPQGGLGDRNSDLRKAFKL